MSILKVGADGVTFSVSAAAPATYDIAGYAALTWTDQENCAIVDAGTLADSWTEVSDNSMCTEGTGSRKGKRQFGSMNINLYYYKVDLVGLILQAAFDGPEDVISCKITLSNGDIRYFTAQVSQFDETLGSSGSDVMTAITLMKQTVVVKDGI